MSINVSVIIPVRDNFSALKRCLEALQVQTYAASNVQIIVVDNDSTEFDDSLARFFPHVIWIHEKKAGSYAARSAGLSRAGGEIIAFTDADCIPSPTWLESAILMLKSSGATIIGGRIDFLNPIPAHPLNPFEAFEAQMFYMTEHQYTVEHRGFAVTANLITYKAVFDRVGGFNPALKSSGDREWVQRAVQMGEVLRYGDSAAVLHPRRDSLKQLCAKVRRLKGGFVTLARQRRNREELTYALRYTFLDPTMYRVAYCPRFVSGFVPRVHFAIVVFAVACVSTVETIWVFCGGRTYRGVPVLATLLQFMRFYWH